MRSVNLTVQRNEIKSKSINKEQSQFQISQLEILVLYSMSMNVNVNMSFRLEILKETIVLMCLASNFHVIES